VNKSSDKLSTVEDLGFKLVSIYDIFPWLREDVEADEDDRDEEDSFDDSQER
jgi:hypothetical protein